jgi:hypothetical protein
MKYMELLKRQKVPTQSTAKTALTPFDSKGSTQGSHFQAKKELTEAEKLTQLQSSDWRQFCDNHENYLPDSYCTLKRDRCRDPFTDCIGWRIKNKKESLH